MDINAFNFDAMKEAVGIDPFAKTTNKYAEDNRFYKLTKDKDGNGAALIRFLPDSERGMIQKLFKLNTTITKNGKKRFVSEYSPSSIGLPCPFQEEWQKLWNNGDKENSKMFGRGIKYIANIKVIKDPKAPENEGKIFLFEMSGSMKDKIQNAVDPSEQDRGLGAVPKEIFNPLKGNSFRLVSKKGANGQINYDASEVINEVTSVYNSVEEAIEDIKTKSFKLSDMLKPESFMSYDKLKEKLDWVTFKDSENVQDQPILAEVAQPSTIVPDVQPAQQVQAVQAVQQVEVPVTPTVSPVSPVSTPPTQTASSLDDLLAGLV
jgi:hypothetical protein